MRKIFTLILVTMLCQLGISQGKQFTMVSKVTADWCPRCGGWGWTYVKNLMEAAKDENMIFLGVHYSGGLANDMTTEFAANLGGGYQPVFYLNQDDLNVSSSNVAAKVTEAVESIQILNSFPAAATVDITPTFTNNTLSVDASVEFKDDASGEYYFALYLVRDNLVHMQASQGANAVHPMILDKSITGATFGTALNPAGPINKDQRFTFSESLSDVIPHTSKIEDMKVVGVIWYKVDDKFTFINGGIEDVQLSTNSQDISLEQTLKIVVADQEIVLSGDATLASGNVLLSQINGQIIPTEVVNATDDQISLRYGNIVPGIYVITWQSADQTISRQLYLR